MSDLRHDLMSVSNQEELEKVLGVFNLTYKKASMQRALELSDLQDLVVEQARKRLVHNADEFSNADLLSYMNTINNILSKIDRTADDTQVPSIAIQNNTVFQLSRDSQERVKEYLREVMDSNGIVVEEQPGDSD